MMTRSLLIKSDRLIDGTGVPAMSPGAILICGEYIEAVGPQALDLASDTTEILECPGQTLLPGLIDCHNHLSMEPTLPNYLQRMNDSVPELTIRAMTTMRVDLQAGVTTSRCLGDKEFLDISCREAQSDGRIAGPRILAAGKALRASHVHSSVSYACTGVESIRNAVRENLGAGVDVIKVILTGAIRGPRGLTQHYSSDEIYTLVDEAHRAGVPVTAHCLGGPALRLALEAGIDVIEHGYFADDQDIEMLLRTDRWLVMTPSPFFNEQRITTLPPSTAKDYRQQRDEVARRLSAIIDAGVKYAAGTDGMHGCLGQEFQYLIGLGASSMDALMAVTSRAAVVCGLADQLGSITSGQIADVIGVEGDPLQDIEAIRRVRTIVQKGRVVKPISAESDDWRSIVHA